MKGNRLRREEVFKCFTYQRGVAVYIFSYGKDWYLAVGKMEVVT